MGKKWRRGRGILSTRSCERRFRGSGVGGAFAVTCSAFLGRCRLEVAGEGERERTLKFLVTLLPPLVHRYLFHHCMYLACAYNRHIFSRIDCPHIHAYSESREPRFFEFIETISVSICHCSINRKLISTVGKKDY